MIYKKKANKEYRLFLKAAKGLPSCHWDTSYIKKKSKRPERIII